MRSERFSRIFDTLKNIEADFPLLVPTQNDRAAPARSGPNFHSKGVKNADSNLSQYAYTTNSSSNPL